MDSNNYYLVDVFTSQPFGGNPLAVFPRANEFTTEQMQRIANEFNLSETTFVQDPTREGSDCTVRIFTPRRELPMAGHPTLGTAYVLKTHQLLEPQARTHFTFDEGIGPVQVDFTSTSSTASKFSMHQPTPEFGTILDPHLIADWLGLSATDIDLDLPVQIVTCGVPYIIVPIRSLAAIGRAELNYAAAKQQLQESVSQEFVLFTRDTTAPEIDVHCRMFAPRFGVPEDAATGSAQGPLGSYLFHYKQIDRDTIQSEQGIELGRPSQLTAKVLTTNDDIKGVIVSGECVSVGEGRLYPLN